MAQNYYCKWCGNKYSTVSSLTSNVCPRNPQKGGRHSLYEGTEKKQYVCKYCGNKYSTITSLTANVCPRNPNKGRHEPAL